MLQGPQNEVKGLGESLDFFATMCNLSPKFKEIVTVALRGGNIHYLFTDQEISFHDDKRRTVSIGVRSGDKARQDSDIIFEMCNAYLAETEGKPQPENFEESLKYGIAVEMGEWKAIKLHYEICNELEKQDPRWAVLNRFKPGFVRPERPWTSFANYFENQREWGHTDQIMRHHPKYGS